MLSNLGFPFDVDGIPLGYNVIDRLSEMTSTGII